MEFNLHKFIRHLTKNLLLSIFFVIYLVLFVYLFFNKGIYVDGHFYKKSANLTQITYSANSLGADFDKIVLEKFIDKSIITIDDKYTVTVFSSGSFDNVVSTSSEISTIDADWLSIANQSAENHGLVW